MNDLRPIIIDEEHEAYFHCWEHCREFADSILGPGEILSRTLGIVEFTDGHIEKILPTRIRFLDREYFIKAKLISENMKLRQQMMYEDVMDRLTCSGPWLGY